MSDMKRRFLGGRIFLSLLKVFRYEDNVEALYVISIEGLVSAKF